MSLKASNFWKKCLPVLLVVLCAETFLPAHAQIVPPLGLEMSLQKNAITLGEPIVVDYKITNLMPWEATVFLSQRGMSWLTWNVVDEEGHHAPAIPDPGPRYFKRSLNGNSFMLSPKSQRQDQVVVSQQFSVSHPGNYRLNVHVCLPYVTGPEKQNGSTPDTADTTLVTDFSYPLTIRKPDADRLRATAQALEQSAVESVSNEKKVAAVKALFSMPTQAALPAWKALFNDPKTDYWGLDTAYNELFRLGSVQTSDFIADMIWNSEVPEERRVGLRSILRDIHHRGNTDLKRYIEQLFVRYEHRVPDRPEFVDN